MATDPNYGPRIEAAIRDYLHSNAMKEKVSEGVRAADAAIAAELAGHTKTGDLFAASHADVAEFNAGWGMNVSTLFRAWFVANKAGKTLNRTSFRRGSGMRRKRGYRNVTPYRNASKPSVIGKGVDVFGETTTAFSSDVWEDE